MIKSISSALDALTAANSNLREDAINKLEAAKQWISVQVHLEEEQKSYYIGELDKIISLL